MKTLCLGGSFNPIHHGHLVTARCAAETLGYQKVLLIPSGHPPHKPYHTDLASAQDRLAMCKKAVEGSDFFEVSDLEIVRPGPSYTLLTVRELQKSRSLSQQLLDADRTANVSTGVEIIPSPTEKVAWLIGADMLNFLPKWHDPAALLREVHFVILARPGHVFEWANLPEMYQHLRSQVVSAPLLEISSTDIRARVRAGRSIEYLTPPAVVDYIRAKALYRG